MRPHNYYAIFVALGLLLLTGCGSAPVNHTIVTPKESLLEFNALEINAMENDVADKVDWSIANNIMGESVEKILNLKHFNSIVVSEDIHLSKELSEKVNNTDASAGSKPSAAILKTKLVQYDEGNSFLQFMFGLGRAEVVLEFTVIDKETNQEILRTRTEAKISNVLHSAEDIIDPSANLILNFIRKNFI